MIGKLLQLNLFWNIFKLLSKKKNKQIVLEKKVFIILLNLSDAFCMQFGICISRLANGFDCSSLINGDFDGTI
jgi:hypothetical protein